MSNEGSKDLARKLALAEQGDVNSDVLDDLLSHDCVLYPSWSGLDAIKSRYFEYQAMFNEAIPDRTMTVTDVVAEGDQVVVFRELQGTHTGDFRWRGTSHGEDVPASGERVQMHFVTRLKVADGRISFIQNFGNPTEALRRPR